MNAELIVVFTERHRLGLTATPYMVEPVQENQPIRIIEQATPERLNDYDRPFSELQQQVVKTLDYLSDRRLHKKFSREKTIKEFYDKLTNDTLEKNIRPEIEKRMLECIELLALANDTPAYFKDAGYSHLYPSDLLEVSMVPSEAVFSFELTPEALDYRLLVRDLGRDFALTGRQPRFITHAPCSFILNNRLYRFTDIDSKKLQPFIEKKHIRIAAQSIPTYMEKFVKNCIRDFTVTATGFDIIEREGSRKAILSLEMGLGQQPVLILKFNYAGKSYLAGTKSSVYVEMRHTNQRYTFVKLQRHTDWEQQIVTLLGSLGLDAATDCYYRPHQMLAHDPQLSLYNMVTWLTANQATLTEAGIEVEQSQMPAQYYLGSSDIESRVTEGNDWFDLRILVKVGNYYIAFHKFRRHILHRTREFELPDGTYFIIPEVWFTRYSDLMHFAKPGDDDNLILDRAHFNLLKEAVAVTTSLDSIAPDQLDTSAAFTTIDIPAALQATLRPYQKMGFSWMVTLAQNKIGGILADDMGLGKTVQTITMLLHFYQHQHETPPAKTEAPMQLSLFDAPAITGFNQSHLPPSLIGMPTSLVHNWEHEIRKFAPSLKVYVYTGQQRIKSKDIAKVLRHYHVVLTSYGILRNDIDYLSQVPFHHIILDESQNIKNPASKIYDAVMALQSTHKLVLTGTPIENSLSDLWAQMNFVNPGVLGTLNFFKNKFVTPITRQKEETGEQQELETRLKTLIHPFILRRTKEMVATDLPPVSEQVLYCDMTPEQQQVYEREKSGVRNELIRAIERDGMQKSGMIALQALTRMRQLANHPALVIDNYEGSSGKYEMILENLESIVQEKHKVLVFSSFVKDLQMIEKELETRQLTYSKLTGATTDRDGVIRRFKSNDECRIFLISLKAGGVGLNLTEADYVFLLNPWWNPAAELQAINRSHRIGQTRNVFVYRFISTGTIEEKIALLQEKKSKLADTFINSNNPIADLSEDEIRELFA
ncbi:DEAD/DEAH box helicase [Breznakibacter xylanolyticus]|nr:DEAD/DEAH box helicase [Breznakibacter xylanolyticus]